MYVAVDAIDAVVFCIDSDYAAWRAVDGEGQQVFENAFEDSSVCENVQVVLYLVHQLNAGRGDYWVEPMDDGFDEWPKVEVPAYELRLFAGCRVAVRFDDVNHGLFKL